METCPKCNSLLRISETTLTFENDNTPLLPTKAYYEHKMVCINPECDQYAGEDLNNPIVVVGTIKNKVN